MWAIMAVLLLGDSVKISRISVAPAETLSVSVAGQGAPVILIPGLFGSAYGFRHVVPVLADSGFQVVIVEPLGIGASGRPRGADYSLNAQAGRVAAVLDSFRFRDAVLVAHSVSAAIAFRLSIERPELVSGIVSIEGGPVEEATTAGFRRAMKLAPLIKLLGATEVIRVKARRDLVASSADSSWVTPDVLDGYTAGAVRDLGATLDVFRSLAEAREPWPLRPNLPRVRCPVRLVAGAAPHRSGPPASEVQWFRDSLRAFAVDSVSGAGHFVFEEQPLAVVAAVMRIATRH